MAAFSNVAAIGTDDGLVLADTSSWFAAASVHASLQRWRDVRLDTAVFTHGHTDHCFGVEHYEERARDAGLARTAGARPRGDHGALRPLPRDRRVQRDHQPAPVPARRADVPHRVPLPRRDVPGPRRPRRSAARPSSATTPAARPTTTCGSGCPARRVLCTGDLFIWASPNCGNPQKVQRYAIEWAQALRVMADLDAEILLPGHGLPILGADRIRTALTESARLLEHLHTETIRMMNEGATLDTILQTVRAPADLLDRPYLGPIYDEPEFVIRNVWRLFGGWYDGDPSHLKPPPTATFAPRSPRSPAAPAPSRRAPDGRGRRRPAARRAAGRARGAGRARRPDRPRRARRRLPAAGRGRGVGHGTGRVRVGGSRVGAPASRPPIRRMVPIAGDG